VGAESLIGVILSGSAPNISRRRAKAKNLSRLDTRPFAGDAPQRTLAEGLAQGDTESVLCFCTRVTRRTARVAYAPLRHRTARCWCLPGATGQRPPNKGQARHWLMSNVACKRVWPGLTGAVWPCGQVRVCGVPVSAGALPNSARGACAPVGWPPRMVVWMWRTSYVAAATQLQRTGVETELARRFK
jgi:hypothetical protein